MTDTPKLLTEAEWRRLLGPFEATSAIQYLGERGLIAPEPVDPLLIEAREIAASFPTYSPIVREYRAGLLDSGPLVTSVMKALRRGMELAREADNA